MYSCFFVVALLLTVPFQSPQEQYRQRFDAAEELRRAGNSEKAETEYASILADAYHKLGQTYSAENNPSAAITALEASLKQRPNVPEALVDLSIALFNSGQYKRALIPIDKAIALRSDSAAAYHMRGKSYFMLNEFDKAATDLQRALQLSPRDYDVAYTLALTHLKRSQPAFAQQIFDRMIAELGNRAQLRILIGKAYRQAGLVEQAIEQFKKAVAIDPAFPHVHYYLGLAYLLKDGASQIDEAEKEFKLEVAAHPDDYFGNYYLGLAFTIGREWDAAVVSLLKTVRIQPNDPDAYLYLRQAYQGLQRNDEAIEVLRRSIALNPDL